MSVESFIDELSTEAADAVRQLLRQAYDRGFREALATAGQPVLPSPAPTSAPPPAPQPAPAVAPSPVEWVDEHAEGADDAPDADGDDDEESSGPVEMRAIRPILPHATVGTLRRRIIRTFDLERFDIEVVICRPGDTDRRQLRSSARLGLYRREER